MFHVHTCPAESAHLNPPSASAGFWGYRRSRRPWLPWSRPPVDRCYRPISGDRRCIGRARDISIGEKNGFKEDDAGKKLQFAVKVSFSVHLCHLRQSSASVTYRVRIFDNLI